MSEMERESEELRMELAQERRRVREAERISLMFNMDMNVATLDQLLTLRGVARSRATRIMEKRMSINRPLTIEDVMAATDLPKHHIDQWINDGFLVALPGGHGYQAQHTVQVKRSDEQFLSLPVVRSGDQLATSMHLSPITCAGSSAGNEYTPPPGFYPRERPSYQPQSHDVPTFLSPMRYSQGSMHDELPLPPPYMPPRQPVPTMATPVRHPTNSLPDVGYGDKRPLGPDKTSQSLMDYQNQHVGQHAWDTHCTPADKGQVHTPHIQDRRGITWEEGEYESPITRTSGKSPLILRVKDGRDHAQTRSAKWRKRDINKNERFRRESREIEEMRYRFKQERAKMEQEREEITRGRETERIEKERSDMEREREELRMMREAERIEQERVELEKERERSRRVRDVARMKQKMVELEKERDKLRREREAERIEQGRRELEREREGLMRERETYMIEQTKLKLEREREELEKLRETEIIEQARQELQWEREDLRREREGGEKMLCEENVKVELIEQDGDDGKRSGLEEVTDRGISPSIGAKKKKTSWCPVCCVDVINPRRHKDVAHLPWWLNPTSACWTCKVNERASAFLRARHSQCNGTWDSEERLIEWVRLSNGLLHHLVTVLECPDKNSFVNYIQDMVIGTQDNNSQEAHTLHKQRMLVQVFSLFCGDRALHCSWSPPQRFVETIARPIIRKLVDRLSPSQVLAVSKWDTLGPEVTSPERIQLIDSHCHVEALLEDGIHSLFLDPTIELQYIMAGMNFPGSWHHRTMLQDERIFFTVGMHPHVTSQSVPEEVWREQQQMWGIDQCRGIGSIGLDYSFPRGQQLHQTEQLHRILQEAPTDLPIVVHCKEESPESRVAEDDLRNILRQHVSSDRVVCLHLFSGDVSSAEEWKRCFPQVYFGLGRPLLHHLSTELMAVITYDRFMLESDAPFQQRTALGICKILQEMSSIVNLPLRVLAEASRLNTCRCFSLPLTLCD